MSWNLLALLLAVAAMVTSIGSLIPIYQDCWRELLAGAALYFSTWWIARYLLRIERATFRRALGLFFGAIGIASSVPVLVEGNALGAFVLAAVSLSFAFAIIGPDLI